MNRVDGVILGVGVVVLIASIVGVILYDEDAGPSFEITWTAGSAQGVGEVSDSGGAETYTFSIPINGTVLAETHFTGEVTVNGARLTPDTVTVSVEGPGGQSDECSFELTAGPSASGSCEVIFDIQDAPEGGTASAEDASAAEAEAEESVASDEGEGTWTVTVAITGGTSAPGPAAASYSVTVVPEVVEYEASASPLVPEGGPG